VLINMRSCTMCGIWSRMVCISSSIVKNGVVRSSMLGISFRMGSSSNVRFVLGTRKVLSSRMFYFRSVVSVRMSDSRIFRGYQLRGFAVVMENMERSNSFSFFFLFCLIW